MGLKKKKTREKSEVVHPSSWLLPRSGSLRDGIHQRIRMGSLEMDDC